MLLRSEGDLCAVQHGVFLVCSFFLYILSVLSLFCLWFVLGLLLFLWFCFFAIIMITCIQKWDWIFLMLCSSFIVCLLFCSFCFASGAPDNIKVWKFPDGNFLQNFSGHQAIVNTVSVNSDNVLVSGGILILIISSVYCSSNRVAHPV